MRIGKGLIGMFLLAIALFAADPFLGTWKLNPDKSTGAGLPKEATIVTEEIGEHLHFVIAATAADGTPVSYTFDLPKAGGEGKISGNAAFDGIYVKYLSGKTRQITYTMAGKALRTTSTVLAQDGKSMTVTVTGSDIHGQPLSSSLIEVFELGLH